ncbi:hypothetical protein IAD21_00871 [Abditibacteriota bacterium]|nr:hypothetical protein IAD21_00871 [Abditibacteriota bacterium]
MAQIFCDAIINCFPPEAIAKRVSAGFVISEDFSGMTGTGLSDGTGALPDPYTDLNPTAAIAWGQTPYTFAISNCSFARFTQDGRVYLGSTLPRDSKTELAGWFLTPRYAALDTKIGANASAQGSGRTAFNWTATSGTWITLPSVDTADAGTGIQNQGTTNYTSAHSSGFLPANRGFRLRFSLNLLPNQTALPSLRIPWGDGYAIRFIHGKCPRLERKFYKSVVVSGVLTSVSEWRIVKELSGGKPVDVRGGKHQLEVFRLAGRLVIFLDGLGYWFLDGTSTDAPTSGTSSAAATNTPIGQELGWNAAYVWLECSGVRLVRADFATIKWSAPDGTPYEGYVERVVPRQTPIDAGASYSGGAGGWKRAGTSATIGNLAIVDNGVKYRLNLKANTDGIDSPLTDKMTARIFGGWVNPTPDPIDVRFACRMLSTSMEISQGVQSSEATIELDRTMLEDFKPSSWPSNWKDYLKMDNPVTIQLRRAGTSYSTVFSGHFYKPDASSDDNQGRYLKLTARDKSVRLQKVGEVYNSIVDHRCHALDLLFAEQLQNAFANGGYNPTTGTPLPAYQGLYYADAIKALVSQFLGDAEAARINGNGDARRYLPRDHPPVMSPSNDIAGWLQLDALRGQPVAAGGFLLPPPYWDAPWDWMQSLAAKDQCVCFFGWPPGYENQEPCLIYGRLPQILGATGLRLHILRDVLVNGSRAGLLSMINVERRPERTFNRVVVAGADEPGLAGLAPSLFVYEANLPNSDAHSALRSWEKTVLIRDDLAYLTGQAIGQGVIQLMQGVDLRWPTFTLGNGAGDERIGALHLVQVNLSGAYADVGLELGSQTFRAENVTHQCAFTRDSGSLDTTIRPRPLTSAEQAAFDGVTSAGGVNQTTPPVEGEVQL